MKSRGAKKFESVEYILFGHRYTHSIGCANTWIFPCIIGIRIARTANVDMAALMYFLNRCEVVVDQGDIGSKVSLIKLPYLL
jgi:hypothetical protein